ncbi:S26 family signal peptidase [Actinomadura sp. 21ATH]|uniref:S26 family signal peptidase n=1 Tax=Actinomadura sp. 21ATH TaxID=1735444 RepID=UPI0035C0C9E0
MSGRRGVLAGLALATGGLALSRRLLLLVTVQGGSMRPALADGDRLLMVRLPGRFARPGDIVALRGPGGGLYVKRVTALAGDPIPPQVTTAGTESVPAGHVVVLGDSPHSLDSRQWGCVPRDRVIGVAAHLLLPRSRPGTRRAAARARRGRREAPLH